MNRKTAGKTSSWKPLYAFYKKFRHIKRFEKIRFIYAFLDLTFNCLQNQMTAETIGNYLHNNSMFISLKNQGNTKIVKRWRGSNQAEAKLILPEIADVDTVEEETK